MHIPIQPNTFLFRFKLTGMLLGLAVLLPASAVNAAVVYEGKEGPGKGKHVVLLAGDEEYRSEEAMPMLGKILAERHGFKCTVLFPITDGVIDPNNQTGVLGLEALKTADLMFVFFRFRELPDKEMKHFDDYLKAGKPIIGIRTSTHAFQYRRNRQSPYVKYGGNSEWPGGFGQQVLGDTWVNHHGHHGRESTRGLIDGGADKHPILKGVRDVWGPTDVYGIIRLPKESQILMHGVVLTGMKPDDPPNLNKSMMPLIWVKEYKNDNGKVNQILCSTIGSGDDMVSEDLRRLFVNAAYYMTGLENKITGKADVSYVGEYKATRFGFNGFVKGVKPAAHELK